MSTAIQDLWDALVEGRGDEHVKVETCFTTGLLVHRLSDELVFKARMNGLKATVETSKHGFLQKTHLITTYGTVKDSWVFWEAVNRWLGVEKLEA